MSHIVALEQYGKPDNMPYFPSMILSKIWQLSYWLKKIFCPTSPSSDIFFFCFISISLHQLQYKRWYLTWWQERESILAPIIHTWWKSCDSSEVEKMSLQTHYCNTWHDLWKNCKWEMYKVYLFSWKFACNISYYPEQKSWSPISLSSTILIDIHDITSFIVFCLEWVSLVSCYFPYAISHVMVSPMFPMLCHALDTVSCVLQFLI